MALLAPPRLFAPVALLANAAATAGSTVLLYRCVRYRRIGSRQGTTLLGQHSNHALY